MYENGKLRPAETIPGMERGGMKESDGGGEFNYDTFLRTLVNVTMYPPVHFY
jgi:hypothetical protein